MRRFIAVLAIFLIVTSLFGQGKKVAVLELRNQAGFKDTDVTNFSDLIRSAGSMSLMQKNFIVMTRENIYELLPQGTNLSDCATSECEVEIGRKIGADYIVTGEVFEFEREYRINLKVHHCMSGQFLPMETAAGKTKKELEESLKSKGMAVFNKVIAYELGKTGVGESVGKIGEGAIEEKKTEWELPRMDKEVVRFESSPKGAVVMVDGDLLCQETPCSKELELGNVTVAMHKERYASHEELIEIRKNIGTISWELKPNFGWLSVVSAPS